VRKSVSAFVMLLILSVVFASFPQIGVVKAEEIIYIRADGSVEGTNKIQRDGNLYTFTGEIYSTIVVEKDDVVIDGAGYTLNGTGAYPREGIDLSDRNSVTIKNMQICGFEYGIYLWHCSRNTVYGNNITRNHRGILLFGSSNNEINGNSITNNATGILILYGVSNTIIGNNVKNNGDGIYISGSNNVLRNNKMVDNEQNFIVENEYPFQDVDASNTVNGKPIYYWVNRQNMAVPSDAGYVALVNCTHIIVQNLKLANNGQGILLVSTTDSTIAKNTIIKCGHGVSLYESSMNTIYGNNITSNYIGVYIEALGNNGVYNRIFHNNFINNTRNAGIGETPYWVPFTISIWDDGYPSGGNYWSDYNGTDNDGNDIGETPYVINENNQDNYPLVNVIPEFPSCTILPLLIVATMVVIIVRNKFSRKGLT